MKIATIYRATNTINGKAYIGFTSGSLEKRQKAHYQTAFYTKTNRSFPNALRKYGWDKFEWDILYQSTDIYHTLNEMEPFFIKEHETYTKGYNRSTGGEGPKNVIISEETRKKMSAAKKGKPSWNKGRKHSPESIEKMRLAKLGKKHSEATKKKMSLVERDHSWKIGRKHSAEHSQNISQALKGHIKSKNHKRHLSKALKGNTNTLGHKHSLVTIEKMSLAASKKYRAIKQIKIDRHERDKIDPTRTLPDWLVDLRRETSQGFYWK